MTTISIPLILSSLKLPPLEGGEATFGETWVSTLSTKALAVVVRIRGEGNETV